MRLPRGLSRQIVLSMSAVVLVVILLSLLGCRRHPTGASR